ncbi:MULTISPECIES: YesL family protein [Niallia]|uniref:YesL family protein n=1 Tax=Niallia TaxID=2837506 RepID=UPI000F44CE36|nr:YesL family protein [Niallia circulans]AYV69583.1 hypothetical protein C2I06_23625 [Niallia circulans]
MQMNGAIGGFYKLCDWIMKLAFVNLLWIAFSLLGLLIFGFFPATVAMFVIVRKLLMGNMDIPVFKTFWESYKTEFIKSNLLGFIVSILGYFLYIDINLLKHTSGIMNVFYYPALLICLGFLLTICYVFPTFVHFDLKIYQVIKNAFIIMLMNPIATIIMVIGITAIYLLMTTVPGMIPLFCGSALAFIMMWSSFFAFTKIQRMEEQHQKLNNCKT